ncbi:phosphoenolpyruvate mutase [Arthrobacter zhaoguopingii]|uniref:phosphoenolpyruvate mutase n=1 Tax=Arthrobacter zhaoguopingii TaxID=2681491 RepID=UPI00135B7B1F|nr:phosphoenolpyruvate mutase [Arthrobacter zhaoguopingii]
MKASPNKPVTPPDLLSLLEQPGLVRLMEVHDPISAMIVAGATGRRADGQPATFDGFWSSSLTDSTSRGYPDNEVLSVRSRLDRLSEIFAAARRPLLMDGDTGGQPEHFYFMVRDLELAGVDGVVIEDKAGLKQNSLLGPGAGQRIADVEEFQHRLTAGGAARVNPRFQVIARLESLILGLGAADAHRRADAYLEAGATGILIHSKAKRAEEVVAFAREFKVKHSDVPLFCVPTTYNRITDDELYSAGCDVVIYANHMLRAAYRSMDQLARCVLDHGRAYEAEEICEDVTRLLNLGLPIIPELEARRAG